jgi:C-terminal processing protease CtpA/Prc
MPISRRAWLFGAAGSVVLGAGALSIPGGGPRSLFGGTPPVHDSSPPGTIYSPEQLRAELTWLVDTMREVGANPFAATSEAAFDAAYQRTLTAFAQPLDARGFFLAAAPLFAALNDGHVSLNIGREFELWRARGGRAFPLQPKFTGDGIFIDVQTHEALPPGTKIESIDGVDAALLVPKVAALRGAQTPTLRLAFSSGSMRQYYYAHEGERKGFAVRAVRANGERVSEWIAATTVTQLQQSVTALAPAPAANYTFTRIANGRVGYIDYRHCADLNRFKSFLKETFASVKEKPIDGLVIDIRKNGGGDSSLNAELWSYLTEKPFSDGGFTSVKVSDRLKREYGFLRYNMQYFPDFKDVRPPPWFMRDGSVVTYDYAGIATIRPGSNPLRYRGPVYLLVGLETFSSALSCAQEAKDYQLATLVGQETGEPLDTTGTAYNGYSPRIGAAFQFATRYYWYAKHPKGRGVIPNVTIVPTEGDIRTHRDPVLDYAVSRIVAGNTKA